MVMAHPPALGRSLDNPAMARALDPQEIRRLPQVENATRVGT